jgi:hypothetical protein
MRYVSWNFSFELEILNFKFETIKRRDLCFPRVFSRRRFRFHCKGHVISGCKFMSLVNLSLNCQYILSFIYIIYLSLHAQVERQFDSQMDPSQVSAGISSTTHLQVGFNKLSYEFHYLHTKGENILYR